MKCVIYCSDIFAGDGVTVLHARGTSELIPCTAAEEAALLVAQAAKVASDAAAVIDAAARAKALSDLKTYAISDPKIAALLKVTGLG